VNKELVIIGKDAIEKLHAINQYYLPNILITGSVKPSNLPLLKDRFVDGKTLFYVCENKSCKIPSEDIDEIISTLEVK